MREVGHNHHPAFPNHVTLLKVKQWAMAIRKVAGVQHLNASIVVAVKVCDGCRASGSRCFVWISKPEAEVINLYRPGCGIASRVIREDRGSWRNVRCLDESFFAENAGKV